mgnify:CR=1 FL=1|jgi:hypothetical protein
MNKKNTIEPLNLYKLNKNELLQINMWLSNYYNGYINADKIILLLEIWLYGFRAILEVYELEKAKKFCLDIKTHCPVEFSWLEEYNVDIRSNNKRTKFIFLFKIFSKFQRHYTLPGAKITNIFDKIRWRLSKLIIFSAPIVESVSRKDRLINMLANIIDKNKKESIKECLSNGLPVLFYADRIHVDIIWKNAISLECAPNTLMEFNGSENILLFDKYIKIIGRQHGGVYGSYINEYSTDYAEKLSDQFVGWGLMEFNQKQHRYFRRGTSNTQTLKNRFVWVERSKLTKMYNYFFPSVYKQGIDITSISCVYYALTLAKIEYYSLVYTGQGGTSLYENYSGVDLKSGGNGLGENFIHTGDIVIFDTFSASLIFYCLENENTFICVTSRSDVVNFSNSNLQWFNILYEYGLAFYNDESELLIKKFDEINNTNFSIPKEVTDYHCRKFINI